MVFFGHPANINNNCLANFQLRNYVLNFSLNYLIMKTIFKLLVLFGAVEAFSQSNSSDLQLNKAENHPIQYYLSIPKNWNRNRQWPMVVILEAADKEYKKNAERFINARGDMPFILIAPFNTNNGNQGRRDPNTFTYSIQTGDYVTKAAEFQLVEKGLIQNR